MKDLTIITTLVHSSSRKIQLQRFIDYHIRFDCKIIIIKPSNIKSKKYNHPNVKIIECEPLLSHLEKLELANNNISTPYMSWIADDDFLGFDFCIKAIPLLKKHSNISACNGLTIFQDEGTGIRKNILYSVENYLNGLKFKQINVSRDKILQFQSDYYHSAVVHGIMRTNVFIEVIKFMIKNNTPTRWGDLTFLFILMMYGKIHTIKSISGIRSHDTRLLKNDSNVYYKENISVGSIMEDQNIHNIFFNYYKELKGDISPRVISVILYFMMNASGSFRPIENKHTLKYKSVKKYYLHTKSHLEVFILRLFNPKINKDIKLAKKLMQEYSLKGK